MTISKNTYGYIRVSSKDQNEGRQLIALQEMSIPAQNIFIDKQSSKKRIDPRECCGQGGPPKEGEILGGVLLQGGAGRSV